MSWHIIITQLLSDLGPWGAVQTRAGYRSLGWACCLGNTFAQAQGVVKLTDV